jgi:hypothetical protein
MYDTVTEVALTPTSRGCPHIQARQRDTNLVMMYGYVHGKYLMMKATPLLMLWMMMMATTPPHSRLCRRRRDEDRDDPCWAHGHVLPRTKERNSRNHAMDVSHPLGVQPGIPNAEAYFSKKPVDRVVQL